MKNYINKMCFEIVDGCQLKCVGCPNSTIDRKISFIPVKDFETCMNNIDIDKIRLFRLFNFGEPILHPELPEIVKVLGQHKNKTNFIEFSVNAQYWNEKRIRETLSQNVINIFAVSCDGNGTKEDYERLRPPSKWEKLLLFIRDIRTIQQELSPNMKLIARIICETHKGRKRWAEIFRGTGFELEFRGWGHRSNTSGEPWNRKMHVGKGVCLYMNNPDKPRLYVDYDGSVIPCCLHPRLSVFGSLLIHKYSDIYKGVERKIFINKLANDRKNIPVCNECEVG